MSAPADGRYLLLSLGSVVRFDLRSGETTVVVPDEDEVNNSEAAASPDGQTVAYGRNDRDGYRLVVREINGANPRTVYGPDFEAPSQQHGWLDRETVLFIAPINEAYRLWSVRSDGSRLGFFVSDTGLVIDAVEPAPLLGKLLVSVRPTGMLPDELWEVDSLGQFERRLAVLPEGSYGAFAWSPDARYVAFCVPTPASSADLVLLHVASGQIRSLTSGPGYECKPVWVP